MVGSYRLQKTLAEPVRRDNAMMLPTPSGTVVAEEVAYIHPGRENPTLARVDLELQEGTGLGIVGPTAAGKSTLSRLLVGTLKPKFGHVRLDGMDVAEWNPDDRGQHIGYMPQDVELFDASVRENIARMQLGDADDVVAAAKLANAHEMIMKLPQGYDTVIGDRGSGLSGGQRQRIGLARALYGDPRFIVLDEPAANLDQDGEDALMGALETMRERGITFAVVTHKPNILRMVDQIVVLKDGIVQMIGPREEVLGRISRPLALPAARQMAE